MKQRGQRTAVAKPATADFFKDGHANTGQAEAKSGLIAHPDGRALVLDIPPLLQASRRPRPKQLWYAVVFPELAEQQQPAVGQAAPALRRLGLHAQRFTSLVSVELPNALLMEIQGSVKLFGSLAVLHAGIDAGWAALSMRALSAITPTTLAALWLARAGKKVCIEDPGQLAGTLAELPIACTAWDSERLQTLRAMGLTQIGEVLRLPRAGLARRLRPDAVLDIDIALARQAAPRRSFVACERFRERCDFETEIETVIYLQKALEPLIKRCARFLRERQAGVQALQLKLRHRVQPMRRVHVGLASITSEHRRLADVLNEKLNRLELAAAVRSMELVSGSLQPLSTDSLDAFSGMRGSGRVLSAGDTAPQLVERLRARLGEAAVYGICSIPEHRPEAAWRRVHELRLTRVGDVRVGDVRVGDVRVGDVPRPVWLLGEPVLLSADLRREGLSLEQGPERIESGWWDGKGVTRDYYSARQQHGARWWIFQERQTKCWYLHGVFA